MAVRISSWCHPAWLSCLALLAWPDAVVAIQPGSATYCEGYAHDRAKDISRESSRGGALGGAARGTLFGTALGGITGNAGRGAVTGAALGAIRGGVRQDRDYSGIYRSEYDRCMRGY